MTRAEVVKYVYDNFAQGDAPAILATFDQDVEFHLAEGHPYSPEGKPSIGADAKRRVRGFEVGAITDRVPGKAGHPSHARSLGHFHQNRRWNIRVEGGSGKS